MKLTNAFIITTLLFIVSDLPGQSQVPVSGSETLLDKLRLNKGINGVETTLYANMAGDPYLFKEFEKGELIVNDGGKFDVNIRFDIFANEMHLKNKDEVFAIIHPEKVLSIEVNGLKFIYSRYIKSSGEETGKDSGYFIVQTDGKCKLLIKKNLRIQDAEPPKLYQDAKPAKFILTKDSYYLKLDDNSAVRIKNKKEILSVLSDQKEALSKFISLNKIGIKDVNDLGKIVSFYNSL